MKNYIITYTILLGSITFKKLTKLNKIWLLFYTFAKIALIVVGGGLAMLPVIEETFVNNNPISSLKLGQARGVAILCAGENICAILWFVLCWGPTVNHNAGCVL